MEYFWPRDYIDGTGWAWYIPLHDGTTSVGIVLTKASYAEKRVLARSCVDNPIMRLYINQLAQAPKLMQFLVQAELISEVKSAGDFSYSASRYAGLGYRIAGDAGGVVSRCVNNCQNLIIKKRLLIHYFRLVFILPSLEVFPLRVPLLPPSEGIALRQMLLNIIIPRSGFHTHGSKKKYLERTIDQCFTDFWSLSSALTNKSEPQRRISWRK